MPITTAQLKAAIEAKIAAATGSTSLEDLTLIKNNADTWLLNNSGGTITDYASLETLIQSKQNALTGSSTLDDITLTSASAFPVMAGGRIKAVHRGERSSSGSTTIPAVDLSKSFILSSFSFSAGSGTWFGTATLANSTTVNVFGGSNGSAGSFTVYWQVVEFE